MAEPDPAHMTLAELEAYTLIHPHHQIVDPLEKEYRALNSRLEQVYRQPLNDLSQQTPREGLEEERQELRRRYLEECMNLDRLNRRINHEYALSLPYRQARDRLIQALPFHALMDIMARQKLEIRPVHHHYLALQMLVHHVSDDDSEQDEAHDLRQLKRQMDQLSNRIGPYQTAIYQRLADMPLAELLSRLRIEIQEHPVVADPVAIERRKQYVKFITDRLQFIVFIAPIQDQDFDGLLRIAEDLHSYVLFCRMPGHSRFFITHDERLTDARIQARIIRLQNAIEPHLQPRTLALAAACHPRLGQASWLGQIEEKTLQDIARLALDEEPPS